MTKIYITFVLEPAFQEDALYFYNKEKDIIGIYNDNKRFYMPNPNIKHFNIHPIEFDMKVASDLELTSFIDIDKSDWGNQKLKDDIKNELSLELQNSFLLIFEIITSKSWTDCGYEYDMDIKYIGILGINCQIVPMEPISDINRLLKAKIY